jgi:hypothetical protein
VGQDRAALFLIWGFIGIALAAFFFAIALSLAFPIALVTHG